jgi:hypothetical protein
MCHYLEHITTESNSKGFLQIAVELWCKSLFTKEKIFFPVHYTSRNTGSNLHWGLLAIDNVQRSIVYYDSLPTYLVDNWKQHCQNIMHLCQAAWPVFVNTCHQNGSSFDGNSKIFPPESCKISFELQGTTHQNSLDFETFVVGPQPESFPFQKNGDDCGMFALMFQYYLAAELAITWDQASMPYFRCWLLNVFVCCNDDSQMDAIEYLYDLNDQTSPPGPNVDIVKHTNVVQFAKACF